MTAAEPMSRRDREDLAKVVRMRAKVAKAQVDERSTALRADAERQLAAIYPVDDEAWAELTAEADRRISALDAEIAAICEAKGIRAEFRPGVQLAWYGRGVNAIPKRRAELHKVAVANIAAAATAAKVAVEAASAELQGELIAGGLTSGEARGWLASIPTAEALMPVLDVNALEAGSGS